MSRQRSDPSAASSSIALLQERFKQLERERERREERELMKLLSSKSDRINRLAAPPEPSNLPQMSPQPGPPSYRDTICPDVCSQHKCEGFQATEAPASISSRTTNASVTSTSYSLENSDVDTSLHL